MSLLHTAQVCGLGLLAAIGQMLFGTPSHVMKDISLTTLNYYRALVRLTTQ